MIGANTAGQERPPAERVQSLRYDVDDKLNQPSDGMGPTREQKDAAREWLAMHSDLRTLARRADHTEYFALAHIQREQTRFKRAPDAHPYDGRRDDPLCLCEPRNCPLKRGELPGPVEAADRIAAGIHAFRTQHSGEPVVLAEVNRQLAAVRTALEDMYRQAVVILTTPDAEVPEERVDVGEDVQRTLEVM